jgi:hypothetical protein
MHARYAAIFNTYLSKQRGAALIVMLVIMIMGAIVFLVNSLSKSGLQIERDKKTAAVLAQAKEALVGFAASVNLTGACTNTTSVHCPRPGDLPCPDTHTPGTSLEGTSSAPCSGNTLGRLPWKTLGLTDLRDSSGERLWYAVSKNFKNIPRTTCTNSNLTGCLNSDTPGTISVFASDGTLLNDGGGSTGAVAIIIAPGDVLQRTDQTTAQDRSSTGINNPQNYLDVALGKDNANFVDGSSTAGFIQGSIKNSNGNVILNDQLLVITQDNIMQAIQKRVAAEVKNCLTEYAAMPQNQGPPPNKGYYPWATARTAGPPVVYNDLDQLEFGHVPDQIFVQTCTATGGINCNSTQTGGMKNSWGATCTLANSNWWVNWKEMVFYGIGHSLRPHNLSHNHSCLDGTSTCLAVNPPSATADKEFVVIVAGKKIGAQVRTTDADKNNFANYLEGQNSNALSPFEKSPLSSTFNDWVVFP